MPAIDTTAILRELDRRAAQARDEAFVAEVLYVIGRACPFPAVVYWEPEVERVTVRIGGLVYARMTAEEVRRVPTASPSMAAVMLGLRARDAYLDLEPLPHDHQLGED